MTDGNDPYRTSRGIACPRCQEPLVVGAGSFVCGNDCGEWLPLEALTGLKLDTKLGKDHPTVPLRAEPTPCLTCKRGMEGRWWAGVPFERCVSHGFWIDARYRAPFHKQVTAMLEEEREIQKLADRLAYPEGRREIAVRLRAVERRVELLEQLDAALAGRIERLERLR